MAGTSADLVLQAPEPHKRRSMQSQRARDTGPELSLRRALHGRGLRYRLHRKVQPGLRREVDVVFVRARVAVFVDGCFWHCCPVHGSSPTRNAAWWRRKLDLNRERDEDTDRRLRESGWEVIRVWEHEVATEAADRIEDVVRRRASRDRKVTALGPPSQLG